MCVIPSESQIAGWQACGTRDTCTAGTTMPAQGASPAVLVTCSASDPGCQLFPRASWRRTVTAALLRLCLPGPFTLDLTTLFHALPHLAWRRPKPETFNQFINIKCRRHHLSVPGNIQRAVWRIEVGGGALWNSLSTAKCSGSGLSWGFKPSLYPAFPSSPSSQHGLEE